MEWRILPSSLSSLSSLLLLLLLQGGVVLVSHDQHLIRLCATEVWLCMEKTVHRLDGGLDQYRRDIENEFRTQ